MRVYIYEDKEYYNLLPLVYLRGVFELRCGRWRLFEKVRNLYPEAEVTFLVREYLAPLIKERYPEFEVNEINNEKALFFNARAILREKVEYEGEEEIFLSDSEVIGFRGRVDRLPISIPEILKKREVEAKLIRFPWDILTLNSEELKREFLTSDTKGKIDKGVVIYGNRSQLFIGKGAVIEAGAIIDLRKGPVYIDEQAIIKGHTIIEGPCYIGRATIIDSAKIREGCSFGEVCRVGGEVEESIFQGYANKHHEGFLGHSYIGEWVNLGALTTNSDLKNNYHPVKVKGIDTGLLKVGCFIGDHSKTAIGTLIPTGAVIGVFANIFGEETLSKNIPSFSWGRERYDLEKAIDTARRVMERRGVNLSKAYERVIRTLYQLTQNE